MNRFLLLFALFFALFAKAFTQDDYIQLRKLVASDRNSSDYFSYRAVAISGNYAVVGAYQEDENKTGGSTVSGAGSVYVFKKENDTWTQVDKLVPSVRNSSDYFGVSVDIDGDWIIVGAYGQDYDAKDGGTAISLNGAAYLFKRDSGQDTWTQTAKIVNSDRSTSYSSDYFGWAVAISGEYAVVGAYQHDWNESYNSYYASSGAAYVFKKNSGDDGWSQVDKLNQSYRVASDYFGYNVDISGDNIIVGAYLHDYDENDGGTFVSSNGAAYIFTRDSGKDTWTQTKKIVNFDRSSSYSSDYFGFSVAIDGNTAVVGAYFEDHDATGAGTYISGSGSAYIYEFDGSKWNFTQKIVAGDRDPSYSSDYFGYDVDVSGDKIVVGAYFDDTDKNNQNYYGSAGSAYVFKKNGSTWSQVDKLVASDRANSSYPTNYFGFAVGINGDDVICGAYYNYFDEFGGNLKSLAGAAYTFEVRGPLPTLTNVTQTNVTSNSADINFTLNDGNRNTNYQVIYGTDQFNLDKATQMQVLPKGSGNSNITITLSNLDFQEFYYYQVVASSFAGTTTSAMDIINTAPVEPQTQDQVVDMVTWNSGRFNANVFDGGADTEVIFEYGTEPGNYTSSTAPIMINFIKGVQLVQLEVMGLSTATKYYYRTMTTNSVGTTYSAEASFWTIPEPITTVQTIENEEFTNPNSLVINFEPAQNLNAGGYIVVAGPPQGPAQGPMGNDLPDDFIPYNIGDVIGNSVVVAIISDPAQTEAELVGLEQNTNYRIFIYPFNWDGNDLSSANFFTNNPVLLNIVTPPQVTIFGQPTDLIGCDVELNRLLSVNAIATSGNLSFQWMKNGEDIIGGFDVPISATDAGISFDTLDFRYNGVYTCDIWPSNYTRAASIRTNPAIVFVVEKTPTITRQPKIAYTNLGGTAAFGVEANIYGDLPPSYRVEVQWYDGQTPLVNNSRISGANSSELVINNVQAADFNMNIWCKLTGYCGSVNSNQTKIMLEPGIDLVQPATAVDDMICGGEMAEVSIQVAPTNGGNAMDLMYQWYDGINKLVDNAAVQGANTSALMIEVSEGVTHTLWCEVSYFSGSTAKVTSSVEVTGLSAPEITTQPMSVTPKVGESATMTIAYTGDEPATVDWYKDTDPVNAVATGKDFVIAVAATTDEGNYYAKVTNECGEAMSAMAELKISTGGVNSVEDRFNLSATPNPTSNSTNIKFNLDKASEVKLVISNSTGQAIASPVNQLLQAGDHSFEFNFEENNLPNGLYFYNITIDNNTVTKQIIFNK